MSPDPSNPEIEATPESPENQERSQERARQLLIASVLELQESHQRATEKDLQAFRQIISLINEDIPHIESTKKMTGEQAQELFRDMENRLHQAAQDGSSVEDVYNAVALSRLELAKTESWRLSLEQKISDLEEDVKTEKEKQDKIQSELDEENDKYFFVKWFREKEREALEKQIEDVKQEQDNIGHKIADSTNSISWQKREKRSVLKFRKNFRFVAIRKMFSDLLERHAEIRMLLADPEINEQFNNQLIENEVRPELKKLVDEGKLSKEETEEAVELFKYYFKNGFGMKWDASDEERAKFHERKKSFDELNAKSGLALKKILNSTQANSNRPNQYYAMTNIIVDTEIEKEVEQLTTTVLDHFDDSKNKGIATREINGAFRIPVPDKITSNQLNEGWATRWPIVKQFAIEAGITSEEALEAIEEDVIDRIFEEELRYAGSQDWNGTSAANAIAIFNNPKAIPLYLHRIRESENQSHVNVAVFYRLKELSQNSDPEKLELALAQLPDEDREVLALIADENSYLNLLNNDSSGNMMCYKIKDSKNTLKEEGDLRLLAEAGWDKAKLYTYFRAFSDPKEELDKLVEIAEILGKSKSETIFEHLNSLLSGIRHKDPSSLTIIDRIADKLNISKEEFYQKIADSDPMNFARIADRGIWKLVFGEDHIKMFLNILPKKSDEKRNAFTHNEYDRTSQFMVHLYSGKIEGLELSEETFDIIIQFVKKFGLSKTTILFEYFRNIILKETNGIELPQAQIDDGITSVAEMEKRFNEIKQSMFSEKPYTDLKMEELSAFKREILSYATGKSTHRFPGGRPSMDTIIEDWERNYENGEIEPKPEEYQPSEILVPRIVIEVDVEAIKEPYDVLHGELMSALENPEDLLDIKSKARVVLENKLAELENILEKKPDNKFILTQVDKYRSTIDQLKKSDNLDQILETLLTLDRKLIDKTEIASVLRELLFKKLLSVNFSAENIRDLARSIESDVTGQGVLGMINIIDNFIKHHVLNAERDNSDSYWRKETWQAIADAKGNSKQVDITKIFKTHIDKLRKEVDNFVITEVKKPLKVQMTPDRGFVGEMSGYIADVCYTTEYPLLVKYPNVIPYKFVAENETTKEKEFIGSVLVFELEDSEGEKVMLVRGFDVPDEKGLDIGTFIEKFLDDLEVVAKQKGFTKILIPGLTGAISNYGLTLNYMNRQFISEKEKVTLSEKFAFNGYDLTENCYLAREVS